MIILIASAAQSADWPHWRGPNFNGSTGEDNLPSNWTTTENVAWSVDLPGPSAATPIIWRDRVFISSTDSKADALLAMCLDRTNGKLLWRHEVAKGTHKDRRSNFAAPSPVTDGKVVTFFFGNGILISFDLDGRRLWSRNIQDDYGVFAFLWTFSSSPTLLDGTLYLQVLQRDVPVQGRGFHDRENKPYLLAINSRTGKTIWKHIRPSKAVAESREAFSTPIPFTAGASRQLLIVGGDCLTSHDPETGRELWRWGAWNPNRIRHWRLVPSPVTGAGLVLICPPKNTPAYAIRPQTGGGEPGVVAWVGSDVRDLTSDVPTPAFYDGDFFLLSDLQKSLSRVDAQTGAVKWTIDTPGGAKYEASPLAADGKIYLIDHDGQVAVVDAADGGILSTIAMDKPAGGDIVRASISAAHGQLFIRTTTKLYCVQKGQPK